MKRTVLVTAVLLALFACAGLFHAPATPPIFGIQTLAAQTLPITVTLAWDANAASDNVTHYVVRLDGAIVGSPTATYQVCTITTAGIHVFAVRAVALWAESPDATLTVNVKTPGLPGNVKVTKNP